MSQLISRILLTILLFPLAAVFNFVVFVVLERQLSDYREALVPAALTDAFIVGYWLLLWRRTVRWTPARLRLTAWAGGGAAAAGAILGWGVNRFTYGDAIGIYIGVIAAALLWLAATVLVWRETPPERSQRLSRAGAEAVVCPACGYNLTGLREARCPECGASYTLNDLFASQPARAAVEVEQA
ncbi:MAG TPA: zinc ribbon domain-containing protein [Tepidisphaeraceae bacterium]|nr:zinc ribbon domain-containing protein [Tepidisphaeraceae bacterium]